MTNKVDFPTDRTPLAMGRKYLVDRGILPESVERCKLQFASRVTCLERINSTRITNYSSGMVIPYDDTADGYATVRWLGDNTSSFGTKLRDDPKLLAPKGPPRVYVPPLVDWDNFSGTLYLCESALKSIVLSQFGYAAIAGNGVAGIYTNDGFADAFPHSLLDGGAVERVVILFDSDWKTNANVAAAIRKLATGLAHRHPDVDIVEKRLPQDEEGANQGIDDAAARLGPEWLAGWLGSDADCVVPEVSPLQGHLDDLNDRYTITRCPSMIIDRVHRSRVSRADFTDILEAGRTFMDPRVVGKGTKMIEVSPAREWLKWPEHNVVEKRDYRPGMDEMHTEGEDTFYNTWQDTGPISVAGDIEPFLMVYRNAIPGLVERKLLLQSAAWMMQNRGSRLEKCFVLIGADQSTGKSSFVEVLGVVMGESNFTSISPHNFTNNFNSSLVGRELILMDDVSELAARSKGQFKNFITGKTLQAEFKGVDAIKMKSTAALMVTSNEFDSIPLDMEDRRVMVCHFNPIAHHGQGSQWWKDYYHWLEKEEGYGILRHWLENMDLSDYDPKFQPPMTKAKQHMARAAMGDTQAWTEQLFHEMDEVLGDNRRSFYTVDELVDLYYGGDRGNIPENELKTTVGQMGQHLNKRFMRAVHGTGVRTINGRKRFWGIRKDGGEATAADVRADIKTFPNLSMI